MKQFLFVLLIIFEFAAYELQAEDSTDSNSGETHGVIGKVEQTIERGVEATAGGIKHGVEATKNGIERGARATAYGLQRAVDAITNGLARGASATARAFDNVAKKLHGSSASEPEPEPEPEPEDN